MEIKHYKSSIKKSKGKALFLKQKCIKSNKVILLSEKSTGNNKTHFLSNILYTKDKKHAFLLYLSKGKNRLYIFQKENKHWKIKWEKEDLILTLKM